MVRAVSVFKAYDIRGIAGPEINASFSRNISHNSGRDSSGSDVDGLNWQDRGLVSINGRF